MVEHCPQILTHEERATSVTHTRVHVSFCTCDLSGTIWKVIAGGLLIALVPAVIIIALLVRRQRKNKAGEYLGHN